MSESQDKRPCEAILDTILQHPEFVPTLDALDAARRSFGAQRGSVSAESVFIVELANGKVPFRIKLELGDFPTDDEQGAADGT